MKIAVIILAIVAVVVGVMFFNARQTADQRQQQLDSTVAQLTTVSNELTVARTETTVALGKVEEGTKHIAGLEQSVQSATAQKAEAEKQAQALKEQLTATQHNLEEEKARLAVVEGERNKLQEKLGTVTTQLTEVEKKLAGLEQTHKGTEAELEALRQQKVALEQERDSLNRKLNDLEVLKAQIRTLRKEQWEQKIAEWRRRDEEAAAGGNQGVLLSDGEWKTAPFAAQP